MTKHFFLALAAVATFSACPPVVQPSLCGPSTCAGCCDSNDVCQAGLSELACGRLGGRCELCVAGQTCSFNGCSVQSTGGGSAGGNTSGGNTAGGDAGGSATGGGTAGGDTAGGSAGGSVTAGGSAGGTVTAGGSAGGSVTAGGSAGGTVTAGGSAGGTVTAGGSAGGTVTAGGSAGGSITAGGSAGGSVTAGGSAGGSVTAGGSAGGGTASMMCPGSSTPCAGCCVGPLCVDFSNQNNSACGQGATSCAPCATGTCTNGQCTAVAMCSPQTCPSGCCQGNLCVPYGNQTATQCGAAGTGCGVCPPGNSCSMGMCTGGGNTCDFFSCAGCCSAGVCQATSSQTPVSCGINGAICTSCQSGATCTGGVCTGGSTCNSTNCNGCCANGTCVTNSTAMNCGHSGNACVACGPGLTCTTGVCVPAQMPACIEFGPTDIDFGTVQRGCRSETIPVSIRNVCNFNVTVSTIGVVGNGFTQTSTATPITLTANTATTVNVTFSPTTIGAVAGVLVVGANHSSSTFAYQTALTASGSAQGVQEDRFTIPRKTDVVLIVDNSCSMSDEQAALGANANAFLAYAFSAGVDFNIGVTTTDMDSPTEQGRFQGPPGATVLRSTTPNLLQTFNSRVNLGINGSGYELMFEPAVQSLSPALLTTTNTGFLRGDAALSVLAFTDASEQSTGTTSGYVQRLLGIKGHRRRNEFSFNFVGPTLANPPSGCSYDGTAPDPRQIEMLARTGGTSAEICNVGNTQTWRAEATRVGQAVFGGRAVWFLTSRPSPATAASLTVRLNNVVIPETSTTQRNWSYDVSRNAVVFEPSRLPGPGQTVGIDYAVACMPVAPADAGVRCDATSCAGCCDGSGVCQPGTTLTACGVFGAACRACQLSCSAGQCFP